MSRIDEIFASVRTPVAYAERYLSFLQETLGRVDAHAVGCLVDMLLSARERGSTVFFAGNGGSAATASHWANDLALGARDRVNGFRALSLADNVAILTAVANDLGYEMVFKRQLEYMLAPNDVLVAISVSGNSPNVVQAARYARAAGAHTVGILGSDGGALRELCDLVVLIQSQPDEFGIVEDVHLALNHLVSSYITRGLRASPRSCMHREQAPASKRV
jgi:D-sedoheptulose 7-phosphate isomerase